MAKTVDVTMDASAWVAVNEDGGNPLDVAHATLQLKSTGPVLVQVTATKVQPGPSETDGLMLYRGGLEEVPLSGLVAGNTIWVRSFEDEGNRVAAYLVT